MRINTRRHVSPLLDNDSRIGLSLNPPMSNRIAGLTQQREPITDLTSREVIKSIICAWKYAALSRNVAYYVIFVPFRLAGPEPT